MSGRTTDDLMEAMGNAPSLTLFLHQNRSEFIDPTLAAQVRQLLRKKKISKAQLAQRAGMSDVYLFQIMSGRRKPSRNRMLCLCVGLSCSLEEAQRLLHQSGYAQLYVRNRRDAVIIYALEQGLDIMALNELLYTAEEETLI